MCSRHCARGSDAGTSRATFLCQGARTGEGTDTVTCGCSDGLTVVECSESSQNGRGHRGSRTEDMTWFGKMSRRLPHGACAVFQDGPCHVQWQENRVEGDMLRSGGSRVAGMFVCRRGCDRQLGKGRASLSMVLGAMLNILRTDRQNEVCSLETLSVAYGSSPLYAMSSMGHSPPPHPPAQKKDQHVIYSSWYSLSFTSRLEWK